MIRVRNIIAITLGFLVTRCASTATYTPRTAIVGYTDKHVYQNKYQVSFRGGKNTPMKQVWEWAYKRAAEVTLENNYRYFVVTDEKEHYSHLSDEVKEQDSRTKDLLNMGGPFPEVNLSIKCYKDHPKHTDDVIDAKKLIQGDIEVPSPSN